MKAKDLVKAIAEWCAENGQAESSLLYTDPSHYVFTFELFDNRSRFRRDCFVIVVRDGDPDKRWVVAYRGGFLQDAQVQNAFRPEPVIIRDEMTGATYYGLLEAGSRST